MKGHRWDSARFVAPALALLGLVTLYPLCYLVYLSLHRKLLIFHVDRFSGIENYSFLLHDARFWNALANTAYFSVLSVSLELLLGLVVALLLGRSAKGRGALLACILIPWAVPSVVAGRMWQWMYAPGMSIINYFLGAKINWLGSPFWAINAAIIMDVWKTAPFVAILLLAGLTVIPRELYQAAAVDGASPWSAFRHITLPLLKPVIFVALIFRLLDAFRVFDAIYVLTGGGPADTTETISIYTYKILFQTLQFGYGSTIAIVVFVCTALISLIYVRVTTWASK